MSSYSGLSVEQLLEMLAVEWNDIYVSRRAEPNSEVERYCVRNHTDEGLGLQGNERKKAYGSSLREAVVNALDGDLGFPEEAVVADG